MNILFWIILATTVNGLVALAGVFSFWIREKLLRRIILILVAFSAGALLSGGLLHLFAESLEELDRTGAFLLLLFGFSIFFLIEKFLHWHHCHEESCPHPYTYLILFGDGVHNFIDGLVIAASFLVDVRFGIITTILIISHELPQELGDFAILLHGGMEKGKALFYNFISQLTSVVGGILGFVLVASIFGFKIYMLPFAAGGFIYIAASDLIPEIKKDKKLKKSIATFLFFLAGVLFMIVIKMIAE